MNKLFSILLFSMECFACPFCNPEIVERQIISETQHLMILADLAPITRGHLLIIPKRHIAMAHEVSGDEWQEFAHVIPQVADLFREVFNADQYIILEKNGEYAGQRIPHVHFHAIPICTNESADKVKASLFLKKAELSADDLKKEVSRLRNYFQVNSLSW